MAPWYPHWKPNVKSKVSKTDNEKHEACGYAWFMERIGPRTPIRWYLKEWRQHRKLTQEQLAGRLDTNKGQISKLERGELRFNDDWIAGCSAALGIEPGDLLRDPNAPDINTLLRTATPDVRERALKVLDAILKAG